MTYFYTLVGFRNFGVLFSGGNCSGNVRNLDETDVDCGARTCPRRCQLTVKKISNVSEVLYPYSSAYSARIDHFDM